MSYRLALSVVRYHLTVAAKKIAGPAVGAVGRPRLKHRPSVTLFLTNSNNRYPLELTLRSMLANTRYEPFKIVVADNGSTDGSLELLESMSAHAPLSVLHGSDPQSEWYDRIYREVDTDYWVALHEDLIFMGSDWLADLIARMESDPELQLLEGEYFPPKPGMAEPVSGEVVDMEESLSTWLFCVRTSLRDRLPEASFAFHKGPAPPKHRPRQVYDIGGVLLRDMREAGLKYEWMPRWYRAKWHHVANMSWIRQHGAGLHLQLKRYQQRDIQRRARKLARTPARRASGPASR
jgi:glycosyltransferase involved in cell wall biosynthesis